MNKEEILAMEAGRELDHLVMKEIFKASMKYYGEDEIWYHYDDNGEPDYEWSCYISPSTNISAAWEVVESMKKLNWWVVLSIADDKWNALFYWDPEQEAFESQSSLAPEAICKAALLAVME